MAELITPVVSADVVQKSVDNTRQSAADSVFGVLKFRLEILDFEVIENGLLKRLFRPRYEYVININQDKIETQFITPKFFKDYITKKCKTIGFAVSDVVIKDVSSSGNRRFFTITIHPMT